MGIFFRHVAFIVNKGLLVIASGTFMLACSGDGSSSKKKSDDLQVSNVVQEVINRFNACDKPDVEQNISPTAIKNVVQIFDEIENADLQYVRCDGTVAKEEKGPVRRLDFLIPNELPELGDKKDIKPVKEISETEKAEPSDKEIHFAVIENERTCSSIIVPIKKDSKLVDKPTKILDLKELKDEEKPFMASAMLENGKLQFRISDSNLKLKNYLNVKDGNNVLKITFFGTCHEYKNSQSNSQEKDFENCLHADEIATKEVLLQVKVKRTEASGTFHYDICGE